MGDISNRILSKISAVIPKVKIEKASADNKLGVACVLFSTNLTKVKAEEAVKSATLMEAAFAEKLGGKAHIVTSSIHRAEKDGFYYGMVKTNASKIAHEDAVKEGSGYHIVAANVFADANDNIWEVKEVSGQKLLVRKGDENLMELFNDVAPVANMSVAAASLSVGETPEFASLVTFFDADKEEYHNGVVLDVSHAYDFAEKKVKEISPSIVVASMEARPEVAFQINQRMDSKTATVPELSAANINDVMTYLDTLYSSAPAFLAAYKDAVLRLIKL